MLTRYRARKAFTLRWLDDSLIDARYGLRQFARSPVVAAVCVLTLALGIGANAAIFSTVYGVLLRLLPFRSPERLVVVTEYRQDNVAKTGSPFVRYQARAAQNTVFDETGAYWDLSGGNGIVFGDGNFVQRLQFSIVTNSFFSVLCARLQSGTRFLRPRRILGNR